MRADANSDGDSDLVANSDINTYSDSDSYGNRRWNTVAIANMRGDGIEREL